MKEIILNSGKKISQYSRPYFVAELNSSHNGKVETAKKMIDAAKQSGCDAVKFQSWSADTLYCKNYYDDNPIAKRMVSRFSLNDESLLELCDYCNKTGIDFSSTPYSRYEVDFLVEKCNVPFVKIASMDLNNLSYINYIAQKQIPIILSTGMGTIDEIEKAVSEIESTGNRQICILHCVSLYPVDAAAVNLNNMILIKEKFPEYVVGYSDHTVGAEVACASVALGASLIEKHFTLDNKRIGWDNQMATEPYEMKQLVDKCLNVYSCLGKKDRIITQEELEQRKKMRRSIVAARDLKKGTVLTSDDLDAKRPGDGIQVDRINEIVGKTLICDIACNSMVNESDLM